MNIEKEKYMPRLVDKQMANYLSVFGALSVEGPKWCGKTWTSFVHANSYVYLDDENTLNKALLDLNLILEGEYPRLIDEWHLVPKVWDRIRRKCDEDTRAGKYILTCSTELNDEKQKQVMHSGAGRIGKIKMYTMSLYESGDSLGEASLMAMLNGTQKNVNVEPTSIVEIAELIVRGGWPRNIKVAKENAGLIPKSYIESILDKDMNDDKKRDRNKMLMLLRSLARNEASVVSNSTLINDICDKSSTQDGVIESRVTLSDYLDVLDRLHLLENQSAYSENYRSRERVGKAVKRHFTDPSLACAILNLSADAMLNDLHTFGFLFEALVERDLRIYIESLNGHLYHFRDNVSGLEVDAILEFSDGCYAAVEIKLGENEVNDAMNSLNKFAENMLVKPKFMCVITANSTAVVRNPENGIYILPITALKPQRIVFKQAIFL